jgi:(2Fe-2S) ferredoxin
MQESAPVFRKYLFVCENEREEGRCCSPDGTRLRELLKQKIKASAFAGKVRVGRSGCLDVCAEGPNMLLMPDNLWFKGVQEKDLDAILKRAGEGL